MSALVVVEHAKGAISKASSCAIGAAAALGSDIEALALGPGSPAAAAAAAKLAGVKSSKHLEHPDVDALLPESCSPLIADAARGRSHVVMAASSLARNWMPRAAALMDCPMLTDVIGIEDAATFRRPIYAGNAIETVRSSAATTFLTVRTTAFPAAAAEIGEASICAIDGIGKPSPVKAEGVQLSDSKGLSLTDASVVVAAGRGVGSAEGFAEVARFASSINAAIGASRAAVDAGYAPNDCQIGQTGKIIAPEIYIAVGISGAIQHVAGIKDARIIVAINKDEGAPIFEIADYGLVGDYRQILPQLQQELLGP